MSDGDERNSSVERSRFHGGGAKRFRIHMYLTEVSDNRNIGQWTLVYRNLQSLYREVAAYIDKKDGDKFDFTWEKLEAEFVKVQTAQVKRQRIGSSDLPNLSWDFEKELMKVLKNHNFDTELIEEGADVQEGLP